MGPRPLWAEETMNLRTLGWQLMFGGLFLAGIAWFASTVDKMVIAWGCAIAFVAVEMGGFAILRRAARDE